MTLDLQGKQFDIVVPENERKNGILGAVAVNPADSPHGQQYLLNMGLCTLTGDYWVLARVGEKRYIAVFKKMEKALGAVKYYLIDQHGGIARYVDSPYDTIIRPAVDNLFKGASNA